MTHTCTTKDCKDPYCLYQRKPTKAFYTLTGKNIKDGARVISKFLDDTKPIKEFATQLYKSVRYSSGRGQYDASPDCQAAYLDGVETAIAMMYIDLTGSPKSEGILAEFIHQELQKARQDWLREEIVRLRGMELKQEKPSVSVYKNFRDDIYGYNLALQTIIDRYQAELDQDKK